MAVGSYIRQTWANGPGGGTPTNATRFNWIEAGVQSQSDRLDSIEAAGGAGRTPIVLTASSGTITPNPANGSLFLHDITAADATLGTLAAGSNGQLMDVVVYSSSATRTLTVAGTAVSITTTSPWWGRFLFVTARDQWVLDDNGGSGGGSSGGTSYTDEQVRDVVAAMLVAGPNVTLTNNDAGDTYTIAAATTGSSGIPASTVTTKGDILAATASATVARVPVGTNGQALVANSANASGLAWAAPTPAAHAHAGADITSGTVAPARLGSGTPSSSNYLRGDGTWQVPPTGGSATETVHTIAASGAAQTLNPTVTGPYKRVTLTANCTFTFAGATAGQVTRMDVELIEDATGGRTVTWPTVKWVGGVPTHITTANSVSVYTFWSSDGSTWFGAPVGLGFA